MSNLDFYIYSENVATPTWSDNLDFSFRQTMNLWKISITDHLPELNRLYKFLSEEEKTRVERYFQKKDKNRFTIGRGMLRYILAKYLNEDPNSLRFKKGLYNKPYLEHPQFHFNISYSGDLIIIGVSNEAIGVDIEYINRSLNYKELAEVVFTQEEKSLLESSAKGRENFFKIWTRKEALLKAVSRGLGDDLKNFSCLDGLQSANGINILDDNWKIQSFHMDSHYYVSMAFQQTSIIKYWNSQSIVFTKG